MGKQQLYGGASGLLGAAAHGRSQARDNPRLRVPAFRLPCTLVAVTAAAVMLLSLPGSAPATAASGEVTVVIPTFGKEVLDLGKTGTNDLQFTGHIYEPLIGDTVEGDLSPRRGLAESWQIGADAKTFTLKLRDNVRWHDGKPFTSDDVLFSLAERYVAKDAICTVCNILRVSVESVEAPDKYTVRITLKRAEPTFLSLLSARDGDIRILPRHGFKKTADGYEMIGDPIGTGPWKFVSFERSVELKLAANEDHWDKKAVPAFKTMRLIPRAQPNTRLSMVRSGEADVALLDPRQVTDAKAAGLRTIGVPEKVIQLSYFGCWQEAMLCHKQKFREALAHAVDIDAITKRIYPDGTLTRLATTYWSEKALGYDPTLKPYEYNPERTKELLREINYSGTPVKLWVLRLVPEADEIMELFDGYLRAAGIKTEYTPIEFGAFRPRIVSAEQNFETTYSAHFYVDPGGARLSVMPNVRIGLISKKAGGFAQQHWDLPKIDAVWEKLTQITDIKTLEEELRRLNHELYAEYNSIPIGVRYLVAAIGPRVKDWTPSAYGYALHFETITPAGN